MAVRELSVVIVTSAPEFLTAAARMIEETQIASVKLKVNGYCAVQDDLQAQRIIQAHPDVILVDMFDPKAAIRALSALHNLLPDACLYACGPSDDPQWIIDAMQAGAREFIPKPISTHSIAMAFARHLDQKRRLGLASTPCGRTYSVTSAKGGSGATSVAINIAATLATVPNARVAILDLAGPLGDVASYLNLKPQCSLSDATVSAARLDEVLLQSFMTPFGDVSVLAGPKEPREITPPALAKLLKVASRTYTHTFVDLPLSSGEEILQTVMDASESVIVVMTPELPAIWRTNQLLSLWSKYSGRDRIRLILNRCDSRAGIDEREIVRALNQEIYWRLPNNFEVAVQAINRGVPFVTLDNSKIAAAYRELTELLTGIAFPKRRSFLTGALFDREPLKLNLGYSPHG